MKKQSSAIKTLTLLNAVAFGGLFVINKYVSENAVSKNLLKTENGAHFMWKHGSVYYRVFGTGEKPLLLLHDASSFSSGYQWNNTIASLSNSYRIYVPDLPGCGRSDKPAITYTNYFYAQFLHDFIAKVIKQSTSVVAVGLSSSFVITAAGMYPNLIHGITMINPTNLEKLRQVPNRQSRIIRRMLSVPVIGTCIYHLVNSRKNLEYRLTEKYIYNPFKLDKRTIDACYEAAHLQGGKGKYFMSSLDGNYLNWDIRRILAGLTMPITILYGEKAGHEKKIAEAYRKCNPNIVIRSLKGAKYLPQVETAEILSTAL